jgi:HSP20 family molecular chaperone IbpA
MFKKKKCEKCGKKIEEKYSFCPYCGNKEDSENETDFGMLGKNDFMPLTDEIKLPMGFNALFNSLVKNLSKEFDAQLKENMKEQNSGKTKKDGISISISTFGNGAPRIKVSPMGNPQKAEPEKSTEKIKKNVFTAEKIKKFSELKREEPKTNIRRLSNKIIYEIEMPDVKSAEDVSIAKLENSIEIKAIGKKKAYAKIIPISLPIKNYNLSEGKLTLELSIKN